MSNKKESGVDRIVGVDPKNEQELLEFFKKKLGREFERKFEHELTPELKALILELNGHLDEFVEEYGGKGLEIPEQAVRFLDLEKLPDEFNNIKKSSEKKEGTWFHNLQKILIYKPFLEGSKLKMCRTIIHEMLHAYSFSSFQKLKEDEATSLDLRLGKGSESIILGTRRSGVGIIRPDKETFFLDFNEAITEELTMRFDQKYFGGLSEIKEEYDQRKKVVEQYAEEHKISIEESSKAIANVNFEKQPDGSTNYIIYAPSYRPEREKLYTILEKIQKANPEEFKSTDDVFKVFAKAQLSGRLLPLARLVEKTYGKGSFREMGTKKE